ncbi:probable LRR receptor-like protein kinase At1g51890 [Impatiens glandulifera]|uniref:probable LRR receptor-like protein kinase At1g51890 n=1 Tax=Impatiens glandulifera TaxID=253017 RepID=UPI001FB11C8F|nr:probable LRR receptor-like protein kinase At1g51890 [Impatiens glandulifera]
MSMGGLVEQRERDESFSLTGFISLDCGRSNGYTDRDTGLRYNSDNNFIDTGVSHIIAPEHQSNSLYQQFMYVRNFPKGTRNCYTLKVPAQANGSRTTFLIRGRFMYGNYDNNHSLPSFDLHIGVDIWDTVLIYNESVPIRKEIIYVPNSDFIQVCLINTNSGIPFISALEIRPMNDTIYKKDYSLKYYRRFDLASSTINLYRYKDDIYDRIWLPWVHEDNTSLATASPVMANKYQIPNAVMNTANIPKNPNDSLVFSWNPDNINDQFYLYLHFAELNPFASSREFNIYVNGKSLLDEPYSPKYLQTETHELRIDVRSNYTVSLNRTKNSTLPPLLNAIELYTIKQAFKSQTNDEDVGGIMGIKSTYKVLKNNNWQGDPCGPPPFFWDGIICSYKGFNPPQIISLNLSSSGLSGEISPFIQNLTSLKTLYEFKGKQLDMSNAIVTSSKDKEFKGNSTTTTTPRKKRSGSHTVIVVIAASVGGFFFLLLAASIIFYCIRRKRKQSTTTTIVQSSTISSRQSHDKDLISSNIELKNCQFSYSEILKITNNFQRVLGKGGFGTVYQGYVGNTPVAVKMISLSSTKGYKQFQAEAKFLVSVNHKNLTSVLGYCDQDDKMGLVYEFMEKGNLETNLSERSSQILNWEERLQIAVGAAQGLEYLHNGCKPMIIHRDVKSSNILLNGKFEAKLVDFGLSKTIPVDESNHVSTVVVGTPGYNDPDFFAKSQYLLFAHYNKFSYMLIDFLVSRYIVTNRLTEKSDVYSFGIVLLEILTGKPAVLRNQENAHIIIWVGAMISTGDATQIADQRLRENFDTNCFWKLVELAMACVSRESVRRPNMTQVVMELKECLASEIARHNTISRGSMSGGFKSIGAASDGMGPLAR